jgi:hypothetical protein
MASRRNKVPREEPQPAPEQTQGAQPEPKEASRRAEEGKAARKRGKPSKELEETALLFYKNGFNVVPVGSDKRPVSKTWSAEKRLSWEEVAEGLKRATGIAIVGGSEHPLSGTAVLVIVDIDRPSLLEKSPTLKALAERTVCYKTGPRCPKCEGKQLEVLEPGKRFRCKGCGTEFAAEEAKRGLGLMVFVEQQAAEKFGLTGTKRKWGEVELLVKNYQLIPPSLHPSGVKYEWVRSPVKEDVTLGIASLLEWDLEQLAKELGLVGEAARAEAAEAPGKVEAGPEAGPRLRELSDAEILRLKELLKEAYRPGYRQHVWLYVSGWAAKARISPVSVAKALKMLYEECGDEDSIKTRGSALCYSYGKAGIDLGPYAEELKTVLGEEPYGLAKSFSPESVKGSTGLQEVLEATLGEETALSVIKELEELFGAASPFRDCVVTVLDYDKQLYAVANLRKLLVARAALYGAGGVKRLRYKEKVFIGAPTEVLVYVNPVGGVTKFKVKWETTVRPRPLWIGPAYVEDIVELLREESLVVNRRLAADVLSALLNAYVEKGRATVVTELESPGFYVVDSRLVASGVEVKRPSMEELREALELLNELAEKWFAHARERFAFVVKWGVVSPFGYAFKQRGHLLKALFLYGKEKVGKTTQGLIVLHMWSVADSKHVKPGSAVDTVARLGQVLSQGTFPVLVNEPAALFEKEEIAEMLKASIEGLVARGKFHRGLYTEIPALASLMFTSNTLPKDPAFLRRCYVLTYTYREKIPKEKEEEFERSVKPRLHKLRAIGDFVASLVVEHGLPDVEPIALAEKLLELAYKHAGLQVPAWIREGREEEFTKGEEELEEELREEVRSYMVEWVNEAFSRHISRLQVELGADKVFTPTREEIPFAQRLIAVLDAKLLPWAFRKDEKVFFTTRLVSELQKRVNVDSLKSLAEMLHWNYNKVKVGKQSVWAAWVKLEDLLEFLEPRKVEVEEQPAGQPGQTA